VGAIYENDQSAEAWAAINDSGRRTAVQFNRTLCTELDIVFGIPEGSISLGKAVTALKRLGFDKVYDAQFTLDIAASGLNIELQNRVKNNGKPLPIISCCSQSAVKFIENFYPDLAPRLSPCRSPREIFVSAVKEEKTTIISIEPCVSNKSKLKRANEPDLTLTVKELARMFKLAGIDFASLPESPFDTIKAERGEPADLKGIKYLTVNGLGEARAILDSIRKGECDAALVEIKSCPLEGGRSHCPAIGSAAIQI
jgi:iron only hydrogenase large subunit-like protein